MKAHFMWPISLIMVATFVACGHLPRQAPETSRAAAAAVDRLLRTNHGLLDLKGIGQMKLSHSGHMQSARMVWAGILPASKLRMDILATPGVTLATLASDGTWVYLRLNQEKRFYKKKNGQRLLQRMIDIPITIQDIVQLLGGKIPLVPHRSAILVNKGAGHHTAVLELFDQWGRVCQRVFFTVDRDHPIGYEVLAANGSTLYRAEFKEMTRLQNYRLPKYLVLSNTKGDRFELAVEKYWLNQPLPPSRFILQPMG